MISNTSPAGPAGGPHANPSPNTKAAITRWQHTEGGFLDGGEYPSEMDVAELDPDLAIECVDIHIGWHVAWDHGRRQAVRPFLVEGTP